MITCRTCAAADSVHSICGYSRKQIDLDGPSCQNRIPIESIYQCDVCKRESPFSSSTVIYYLKDNSFRLICANCSPHLNTCRTCASGGVCDFETSDCNLPKQVIRRVTSQNGSSVMQTTIKNPERIAETCKKHCPCWSDEDGCLKQNGCCGAYCFPTESWGMICLI